MSVSLRVLRRRVSAIVVRILSHASCRPHPVVRILSSASCRTSTRLDSATNRTARRIASLSLAAPYRTLPLPNGDNGRAVRSITPNGGALSHA
jgi:hypothetical protein